MSDAIDASAAKKHLPATANGKSVVLAMDRLFREGYDGCEMPAHLGTPKPWVQPLFRAYLELLVRNNYLDFGALLAYCLRLFRERPVIARHYRTAYPFVCVDEYQDTNTVQDLLLRALYLPTGDANLFVVADEDQTIYQWNGASPDRLAALRSHYGMDTIQLPQSYRCPPRSRRVGEQAHQLQPTPPCWQSATGLHERWGDIQFGSFGPVLRRCQRWKRSG